MVRLLFATVAFPQLTIGADGLDCRLIDAMDASPG
jgi:hypothetical protein